MVIQSGFSFVESMEKNLLNLINNILMPDCNKM